MRYNHICCPHCGSYDVSVQVVNEVHNTGAGCFTWIICIILACTVIGLIIVIPFLISRSRNVTRTVAVCQHCGNRWQVK